MQKLYLTYVYNWDGMSIIYNGISEKYARELVRANADNAKSFDFESDHTYVMQTWMNGVLIKSEFLRHVVFDNGQYKEILDKNYY